MATKTATVYVIHSYQIGDANDPRRVEHKHSMVLGGLSADEAKAAAKTKEMHDGPMRIYTRGAPLAGIGIEATEVQVRAKLAEAAAAAKDATWARNFEGRQS